MEVTVRRVQEFVVEVVALDPIINAYFSRWEPAARLQAEQDGSIAAFCKAGKELYFALCGNTDALKRLSVALFIEDDSDAAQNILSEISRQCSKPTADFFAVVDRADLWDRFELFIDTETGPIRQASPVRESVSA